MNNKEHLNEEKYQKTKTKLSKTGTILLCLGIPMAVGSIILQITQISENGMAMALLGAPGFIMTMFGVALKLTSNGREINAFYAQQQMPIAKEGIEKMAPSAGVAAKEIAKGIKEGLKDEEK